MKQKRRRSAFSVLLISICVKLANGDLCADKREKEEKKTTTTMHLSRKHTGWRKKRLSNKRFQCEHAFPSKHNNQSQYFNEKKKIEEKEEEE